MPLHEENNNKGKLKEDAFMILKDSKEIGERSTELDLATEYRKSKL